MAVDRADHRQQLARGQLDRAGLYRESYLDLRRIIDLLQPKRGGLARRGRAAAKKMAAPSVKKDG